jgi:hypothetical protein
MEKIDVDRIPKHLISGEVTCREGPPPLFVQILKMYLVKSKFGKQNG